MPPTSRCSTTSTAAHTVYHCREGVCAFCLSMGLLAILATCYLLLETATCHLPCHLLYILATYHRWVLCLSMGPGACLEGLVLRPPRKLLPELGTRGAFEFDPASLERLKAVPQERLRLSDSSPQRHRLTGSSAQWHAPRSSIHRSTRPSALHHNPIPL